MRNSVGSLYAGGIVQVEVFHMNPQPASLVRNLIVAAVCAVTAACGGHDIYRRAPEPAVTTVPPAPAVPPRSVGEQAAIIAVRQIGIPYRYGGSSRSGFDCSGLVQYAYSHAGKQIPRTTASQWRSLQAVDRDDLQTGDVLFFRIKGKVSHVGMYLGDGRFVHAPSTGREVTVAALDAPYYRKTFVRAGRP
jgi:cell wall-associated NlpC family hydrolase